MFEMADAAKKTCPVCQSEMELESKSYPMGSAFLKINRFHVDIYRCPNCDRVELFAAKSDLVTCPVCGCTHSAQEKCFTCALSSAFDGTYTN